MLCCYFKKGDYSNAIHNYEMAIKKDSLLTPVYSNLATTYSIIKDYSKANKALDSWILIEPESARAHYLKGLLYFDLDKTTLAIKELEQAIKLNPSDSRSMYNLATYYYQENKDLKLAERYIKNALKIESQNQDFKYLLALIYQNLGQLRKAQSIMNELNSTQ